MKEMSITRASANSALNRHKSPAFSMSLKLFDKLGVDVNDAYFK